MSKSIINAAPVLASLALSGTLVYVAMNAELKGEVARYTGKASVDYALLAAFVAAVALAFSSQIYVAWQFVWNCFLRPLGKNADQKSRLDSFYAGQAAIYDKTRSKLLRGRSTMLRLSAAHLKEQRRKDPKKRLVWLDIGGGTGWNVEEMDKFFPMAEFDAVYVLDLCAPLLDVSRARFAARGWKNVHCLLQDATTFVLPEWEQNGVDPQRGGLDFVTMSYSLSMMPDFYALLDRINRFLSVDGLLSVCDFYVSARESNSLAAAIGDVASRKCGWLSRFFWMHWFEFDHVDLHPSRRAYLEHTFGTIKSYNGRNKFIFPFLVKIPYYINLCTSRRTDTSSAQQAYDVEAGNTISAHASPLVLPMRDYSPSLEKMPALELDAIGTLIASGQAGLGAPLVGGGSKKRKGNKSPKVEPVPESKALKRSVSQRSDTMRIDIAPEGGLTAFHYSLRNWRVPYLEMPVHREFRTWIYGFAWEDPAVDMQHLNLTKEDIVLCITSAGCNALHYMAAAQPKRIHAVDMNPCQGHLLELKLAAIAALSYDDFWLLFGEGRHPNFRTLLDNQLSPFLSSPCYSFWRANIHAFDTAFYLRGYSGWALRLANYAFTLTGVRDHVRRFCAAPTLVEQKKIWDEKLRPVLLSGWIVNLFLANQVFLWNALGVPCNQAKMFLDETTTRDYAHDTLDPVAASTHIAKGAYHYQVCLEHKYTKASCPLYLTREGFDALKKDNAKALNQFRLHTDSIVSVMKQLGKNSLTVAVVMDLQDWFNNSLDMTAEELEKKPCELTRTIKTLHAALKPGGRVFWRSAAISPWYAELYRREGFRVERIHAREIGGMLPIDRVNMYASFYKAVKL